MQGMTESLPDTTPVEGAQEYLMNSDSLVPLAHPVGEKIGENGVLIHPHLMYGCMLPDFAKAYIKESGREMVAVHAAKGSTKIAQWLKNSPDGDERYRALVEKISGAKNKVPDYEKMYFVWLQGESDSGRFTSYEDYKKMIIQLKNDLKADVGIEKFLIISIGYFPHYSSATKEDDERIMKAQADVCIEDSDFVMLTDIAQKLSLDKEYINPDARGHYNNKAQEIIGKAAGEAAAKLR